MDDELHGITAGIFFGLMTITSFMCTLQLRRFQGVSHNLVSGGSLDFKMVINLLMIIELEAVIYVMLEKDPHSLWYKEFFNACEWILMTLNQFYFMSFYFDWGDLEIVL